jgi:hypothetical protein
MKTGIRVILMFLLIFWVILSEAESLGTGKGKFFTGFVPAVSDKAGKAIREKIRE